MLSVAVITLFPEMFDAFIRLGVIGRAVKRSAFQMRFYNPRDFVSDPRRTIDDRPFGGGPGMLLMAEPLIKAVAAVKEDFADQDVTVVALSPEGQTFSQPMLSSLLPSSGLEDKVLVLLAGRYEGVDERFMHHVVDRVISVGDFVLSGGELPAMIIVDALVRCLPSVLGNVESTKEDAFAQGLLGYPQYSRPRDMQEYGEVPEVLLSGHAARIAQWRHQQALGRTWQLRPDMLWNRVFSLDELTHLESYKASQ